MKTLNVIKYKFYFNLNWKKQYLIKKKIYYNFISIFVIIIFLLSFLHRWLWMGPDGSTSHSVVGAVQFRRSISQGSRTCGHRQGRWPVVRGSSFLWRWLAASKNKPESFVGIRVLGRHGACLEPLRGQINYC